MYKKKLLSIFFVTLMLLQFSPLSYAKADFSQLSSSYYYNHALCFFISHENQMSAEQTKVSLLQDGEALGSPQTMQILSDSDIPIKYIFLVDCSDSMQKYHPLLLRFVKSIMEKEKQPISVTVLGFGERFEIIAENLSTSEEVDETFSAMQYTHKATDIYGGLIQAVQYQQLTKAFSGIVNMVLITDGVPYAGNSGMTNQDFQQKAQEVSDILETTSEMVVHTAIVGNSKVGEDTLQVFRSSTGKHLQIDNESTAMTNGNFIAQWTDSLYVLGFPANSNYIDSQNEIELFFDYPDGTNENIPVNHTRDIQKPNVQISDEPTTEDTESTENFLDPTETESLSESIEDFTDLTGTDSLSESTENLTDPTETETASESDENLTETVETSPTESPSETPPNKKESDSLLIPILSAVSVLLLLCIGDVWYFKKNSVSGDGIRMHLEVISGSCKTKKREFILNQELLIGSHKSCDIVLDDRAVAEKNTRIYIQNNMIYIENLGNPVNTFIEGMKIYAPNRLRSGNEITIGNVHLRFKF